MKSFLTILSGLLLFSQLAIGADYRVTVCGQSYGPESMDPNLVNEACFVELFSVAKAGLLVTLRSGEKVLFPIRQYDATNNVIALQDQNGAYFRMSYVRDENGKPAALMPLAGEAYPFSRYFEIRF